MTGDHPEVRHLPEENKCVGFSQHTPTRKKTRVEPVSFEIECARGFVVEKNEREVATTGPLVTDPAKE